MSEHSTPQQLAAALKSLVGLRLAGTAYPCLRSFHFVNPNSPEVEWALHIQCPWRIEAEDSIVTGSYDTWEPADPDAELGEGWEPAKGGGLAEWRLRNLFDNPSAEYIANNRPEFVCTEASLEQHGSATLRFTGAYTLRLFPTGSRGEHWRVFVRRDLESHVVCGANSE